MVETLEYVFTLKMHLTERNQFDVISRNMPCVCQITHICKSHYLVNASDYLLALLTWLTL